MIKLEGIAKLRGKIVLLENIENPVLSKILHLRLRGDKFNFWYSDAPSYRESKGYPDYREYQEHNDKVHTDKHRDNHTDRGYAEANYSEGDYTEHSRNNNHTDHGYSEHTDYWR